ncbi:MAG: immune inhibitor A [Candidatus Bathyarchaeia archaeon]
MKVKLAAILIVAFLIVSTFSLIRVESTSASPALPDYTPIDIADAPQYDIVIEEPIEPRSHHSYWNVGDIAYWLIGDFYWGVYRLRPFYLAAIGNTVEIWVATDLRFGLPPRPPDWPGDPRPTPVILPEQIQYILEEFDNKIYPIEIEYFGTPDFHDGSYAALPGMLGLPPDYYYEETGRNVILVSNIRDTNYYYYTYPYYIAGFYTTAFEYYFDRNVISIDCYDWEHRVGPPGYEWIPGVPVTRPYVYESTVAHEYQHLIHRDYQPEAETFMNEGCSMYAELLCGYGIDAAYLNSYFATPDNSLTVWGDQGDINILADYGAAALWVVYLSDHYGGADLIRYYVQSGIPGIEGINNALKAFKYKVTFEDVYHDWRLANLIRKDFPGCKKYNYKSLNLNDPEIIPVRIYEISGLPVPWTKGTDFGNTITILGYDTGVSKIGPFGTDYIALKDWTRPGIIYFDGDDIAPYGWTYLEEEGIWWSGADNLMDTLLVGKAYVDPADPTLVLKTYWDIEEYWDFGFVQVSTDGGKTWTSLENEYTTYEHDPEAHPAIIANLPGLTGWSEDWITMDFDLTAYAGMNILVGFRYMTDWATLYEGWYIASASVSGVELTLTPVYPEADFQVTIVYAYIIDGMTLYIPLDMWLCDKTETGLGISSTKKPNYTILVISPTMRKGWVDYKFKAEPLPLPKRCILDKLERFEGILR